MAMSEINRVRDQEERPPKLVSGCLNKVLRHRERRGGGGEGGRDRDTETQRNTERDRDREEVDG